jgi:DNA (cytosine-5)-methyltransferase 1
MTGRVELLDELVIDSFAGGGGTSEGIVAALGTDPDIAINHDKFALAMHRINHPGTQHQVEDVVTLDAISMCAGRPIGMLWMSPDCKDHSKAKGSRPREKNIRGLAWAVFGWCKALPEWQRPRVVFLENVEEFEDWGPLKNGQRCPVQKGKTFQQFVGSWRALGYDKIEWRQRRAWISGAGTIRKRLYVIMRRDDVPIVWPEPTHGNPNDPADAEKIAAGLLKPWVIAADSIDFSRPCPSIFDTAEEIRAKHGIRANRPLRPATLARLAKGTFRYVLDNSKPFIVPVTHQGDLRVNSIEEPLRTGTCARRGEHAVVTPFLVPRYAERTGQEPRTRSVEEPAGTIVPDGNEGMLAAVHLATMHNADSPFSGADRPTHTLTAEGANISLVAAFLAQHNTDMVGHPPTVPLSTIVEKGSTQAVVAASMVTLRGSDRRDAPADAPLNTASAGGNHSALSHSFLAKYYGAGVPSQATDEPLHTDTAKPRFGFAECEAAIPPLSNAQLQSAREVAQFLREHGYWDDREFVTVGPYMLIDIGMRMLTPRERFNAQGFRRDYIIDRGLLEDGTIIHFTAEQQGRMCGNSVCPTEAAALIGANYRPRKVARPRRRAQRTFPLLEAAE